MHYSQAQCKGIVKVLELREQYPGGIREADNEREYEHFCIENEIVDPLPYKTIIKGKWSFPYNPKTVSDNPNTNTSRQLLHDGWEFVATDDIFSRVYSLIDGMPEDILQNKKETFRRVLQSLKIPHKTLNLCIETIRNIQTLTLTEPVEDAEEVASEGEDEELEPLPVETPADFQYPTGPIPEEEGQDRFSLLLKMQSNSNKALCDGIQRSRETSIKAIQNNQDRTNEAVQNNQDRANEAVRESQDRANQAVLASENASNQMLREGIAESEERTFQLAFGTTPAPRRALGGIPTPRRILSHEAAGLPGITAHPVSTQFRTPGRKARATAPPSTAPPTKPPPAEPRTKPAPTPTVLAPTKPPPTKSRIKPAPTPTAPHSTNQEKNANWAAKGPKTAVMDLFEPGTIQKLFPPLPHSAESAAAPAPAPFIDFFGVGPSNGAFSFARFTPSAPLASAPASKAIFDSKPCPEIDTEPDEGWEVIKSFEQVALFRREKKDEELNWKKFAAGTVEYQRACAPSKVRLLMRDPDSGRVLVNCFLVTEAEVTAHCQVNKNGVPYYVTTFSGQNVVDGGGCDPQSFKIKLLDKAAHDELLQLIKDDADKDADIENVDAKPSSVPASEESKSKVEENVTASNDIPIPPVQQQQSRESVTRPPLTRRVSRRKQGAPAQFGGLP